MSICSPNGRRKTVDGRPVTAALTARPRLKDLADYVVYLLYLSALTILSRLPLAWLFRFGQGVGWLGYRLFGKYRRLASANIRIAFPDWTETEVAHCAESHFKDLVANMLCSFTLLRKPWDEIKKHVDLSSMERFRERVDAAPSFILVINHIGNWELHTLVAKTLRPGPHGVIYQKLSNRFIDEHIRKIRELTGLRVIERQQSLSRSAALLKAGAGVGILIDQHAGDKGIWVPFFGRLASTTPLPAILAKKTGAELLPAAMVTVGVAQWRLELSDFIPQQGASIEEVTYRANLALEALITKRPSDWFWVHQRWKTPAPKFLLRGYKRGVYVPQGVGALKPFRVLVRSSNWLGDAVMTVPAVRRIKRGRPDVHLTILTRTNLAEFWRTVSEVDEVIAIRAKDSIFSVAANLREKFDVAILFPNSPRVAIEAWLARIPRRVGYFRPWRNWFVNQSIKEPQKPGPLRHQSNHYLRIAQQIGADLQEPLEEIMSRETERGLIGVCPGAEYGPAKRWTEFHEAAKRLSSEQNLHWLIFGTAKEQVFAQKLVDTLGRNATDLTGKTTMLELMQHLRRCQLLLTNDTGTMHLAAHLGVPTVSIFGSTEPALTGPMGDGHVVIRHHVECSPCFLRECPLDFRCMKAVTVEEVVEKVRGAIAATSTSPAAAR
jgi:heptosyltransferase II